MAYVYNGGYLGTITVRDRGAVPRGMRRAFNALAKEAWHETGLHFHTHLRDKRFTPQHAREAGYKRRKGELLPVNSKAWRRSYSGRKQRRYGHQNPLELTGETRQAVRYARITSTSRGARISYQGARKFNYRHPKSQIRMSEEFRTITPREVDELAAVFDRELDARLAQA